MNQGTIAFFYPEFFPVTGGSAVHGYYLAKGLTDHGYKLLTCNSVADNFTVHHHRNFFSVIRMLRSADLVYIRTSLLGKSMYLPKLAKMFGKKIIIEFNGPSDELIVTRNYTQDQIKRVDKQLSHMLQHASIVITVTDLLAQYCRDTLLAKNVRVIENGGERYEISNLEVSLQTKTILERIKLQYQKVVCWSGTNYPWQGFEKLKELIEASDPAIAFCILTNDTHVEERFTGRQNVIIFKNISFDDARYMITQCDAGLALYGDYNWSRFKECYGSSLKYFEYIANDLAVITTPTGHMKKAGYENVLITDDVPAMHNFLLNAKKIFRGAYRSWTQVVDETISVIHTIK